MIFFSFSLDAQNAPPVITSILVQFESSTNELVVYYNLQDTENDNIDITFLLSDDGGATYLTEPANATGHVGFPIAPGTGKQIRWNIGSINDIFNYSVRLVANDRQTPGIETLVAQVDSNRLLTDLQMIEGTRHYQANPTHLEEIKDTIEDRFERAGLQTRRQEFQAKMLAQRRCPNRTLEEQRSLQTDTDIPRQIPVWANATVHGSART